MTHPRVYKKLLAELEKAIGYDGLPTHEQVKDLPYLQATIDEGWISSSCVCLSWLNVALGFGITRPRPLVCTALFPRVEHSAAESFSRPGWVTRSRISEAKVLTLCQTEMSVPAYTIQHDKAIWGDPDNFRPERWLEEKDLHRYFLIFGKGPRACVCVISLVSFDSLIVFSSTWRIDWAEVSFTFHITE